LYLLARLFVFHGNLLFGILDVAERQWPIKGTNGFFLSLAT